MPLWLAVMAPLLVTAEAPEPRLSRWMPLRLALTAPVLVTVEAPGPGFPKLMPCVVA